MVLFFTSTVTATPTSIYMGRDKVENEELIKYGTDRDVWFHVDKLSSAHVYVRLPDEDEVEQYGWENMPEALVRDCAQLTKVRAGKKQGSESVKTIVAARMTHFGDVHIVIAPSSSSCVCLLSGEQHRG